MFCVLAKGLIEKARIGIERNGKGKARELFGKTTGRVSGTRLEFGMDFSFSRGST